MLDYSRLAILAKRIARNAEGKKLIIFGTGNGAFDTILAVNMTGFEIDSFVDNAEHKWGSIFFNKKIKSPTTLLHKKKGEFLILIASNYYVEIGKQLNDYGFEDGQDYLNTFIYNNYEGEDYEQERIINGVRVGKYTYGAAKHCNPNGILKEVGAFCSFNDNIVIGETNHPTKWITTHPFTYYPKSIPLSKEGIKCFLSDEDSIPMTDFEENGEIIIGNDVWIGTNVVILPNVKVGNGAIIAAGAVVTKDVPDYAIVGGIPAKTIKYRFSIEEIEVLNRVCWWNWDNEKIKENIYLFRDKKEFFDKIINNRF